MLDKLTTWEIAALFITFWLFALYIVIEIDAWVVNHRIKRERRKINEQLYRQFYGRGHHG